MIKEKDYMITNQEILGGLKSAIERGENLKQAMMTFYRAGYEKKEIEEAAKVYLDMSKTQEPLELKRVPKKIISKGKEKKGENAKQKTFLKEENKQESKPKASEESKGKKEPIQKVSKYESKPPVKKSFAGNMITIVLVLIFLILLGTLASVILFKDELVVFFNNLFG